MYSVSTFCCRLIFCPLTVRMDYRLAADMQRPVRGPLVLVANHISHFDPPVMVTGFPGQIDFMAMTELFENFFMRWLLTNSNTFPVNRHRTDLKALRIAKQRLQAGRIVCLFPEGGLRTGESSVLEGAPLPPGGTLLAQSTGAPIRPCLVLGTDQLYAWRPWQKRPRLSIRFGAEIAPGSESSKDARQELNHKLEESLRRMYHDAVHEPGFEDAMVPRTAQERWSALK